VLQRTNAVSRMERAALQALSRNNSQLGGGNMLRWALAFFVIAIIAAVFGFAGIAVAAAGIAKLLFYLFLILFLVALVGGLVRRA
jgi:uncharacterized membrane protein YtjA (UPF0391 family)